MSYFNLHYHHIKYPFAEGSGGNGLRKAQIGGAHAVAAHFAVYKLPAIIVMPTGSGKTAVLCMTPYLRRATRVLVVTPSRLVRDQIMEEMSKLITLKQIGVLAENVPVPKTLKLDGRIDSAEAWEALREYDVVVSTPNSVSPEYDGVPAPPPDLFDLILVDEAHHEVADTWRVLLDSFPDASKVLFTATPYRQDGREIRGRMAYVYPIRMAREDGIFGNIRYIPVTANGESHDVATAKKAEEVFRTDRDSGLQHFLMVRTDQKTRAEQLEKVYEKHTNLKLRTINSGHSYTWIKNTIAELRAGNLDGVICVDMMGEGFDFPQLKIAAIHSPHLSLSVTLQFIGRFTRTNAENIGEAKFIAVPTDIGGEVDKLFKDRANWQELVTDLTAGRVEQEQETREIIEAFGEPVETDPRSAEVSLYALWPYSHVKVYYTSVKVNIAKEITLRKPFEIQNRWVDETHGAAVIITNEQQTPLWTELTGFNRSEYDLFVIYYDLATKLLFINASRRSTAVYEEIAKQYTGGKHRTLSLPKINRVLRTLANPEFFNVGMKNRVTNPNSTSYHILSGPRAEHGIDEADARLNHRGHVFGKGTVDGTPTTLGYSSASKVWRNANIQIPDLIKWCRSLAAQIASEEPMPSIPGLDLLSVGKEITVIPDGVIAAEWHPACYKTHATAKYKNAAGEDRECDLSDLDLMVDRAATTPEMVVFVVKGDGIDFRAEFSLTALPHISADDENAPRITLTRGTTTEDIIDHLNNYLPSFYCADFSMLRGTAHFSVEENREPWPTEDLAVIDWPGFNVDIEKEFWKEGEPTNGKLSIHDHLCVHLNCDTHKVVVYDHGTGEIADVLTFHILDGRVCVTLYHVKGSSGAQPGDRVDDVYEVCGQVIKSLIWLKTPKDLRKKLRDRLGKRSKCLKGTLDEIEELFEYGREVGFCLRLAIVQPGMSKTQMSAKQGEVVAAASNYLRHAGVDQLILIGSV